MLYLIDASIYIFQAWHTLPDTIRTPAGEPANAAYGFADFLARLLQQSRAQHIAIAFDESLHPGFRNRLYPQYKANRPPAPSSLKRQFQWCRELCRQFGLPAYSRVGYEADDIIGTLAEMARTQKSCCCIVSADKDLSQFIQAGDIYWNHARDEQHDTRALKKRFGVETGQIADLLALSGDKVDNIPGVPGVGPTTAAKLLKRWGNLDTLFDNIDAVAGMKFRGAAQVSVLLREHEQTVRLARQLTGLVPVPDLPVSLEALVRRPINPVEACEFMQHSLGFDQHRCERLLKTLESSRCAPA